MLQPGVGDALAALAAYARVVVVTRAPRRVAERILGLAGLDPLVGGVIAAEDAGAPKPSPAGYERALARLVRLGIDRRQVVALEDSRDGLAAAHAAQVAVVAVGPLARGAAGDAPWLATVADLTYDALVELLANRGASGS
jgi:HAD superfamily hydrolase (TIGR01509 family)